MTDTEVQHVNPALYEMAQEALRQRKQVEQHKQAFVPPPPPGGMGGPPGMGPGGPPGAPPMGGPPGAPPGMPPTGPTPPGALPPGDPAAMGAPPPGAPGMPPGAAPVDPAAAAAAGMPGAPGAASPAGQAPMSQGKGRGGAQAEVIMRLEQLSREMKQFGKLVGNLYGASGLPMPKDLFDEGIAAMPGDPSTQHQQHPGHQQHPHHAAQGQTPQVAASKMAAENPIPAMTASIGDKAAALLALIRECPEVLED